MQNWLAGLIIAACMFYGFVLVSKNEQQQTVAATSTQAAVAAVIPRADDKSAEKAVTASLSFGGYPCGVDCSMHEEGYSWAERNNVTDPDSCTGNSAEFIEGCRVYAMRRSGTG